MTNHMNENPKRGGSSITLNFEKSEDMESESSLEKQDFPFGHDNGKELKRGRFDDTRRNDALLHEAVVGGYLDTVRMLIGAVRIFFIPNSHSHLFNKQSSS